MLPVSAQSPSCPNALPCAPQYFRENDADGARRPKPYTDDLTSTEGVAVAQRFIEWVGQNMPGYTHSQKAPSLVSCSLRHKRRVTPAR